MLRIALGDSQSEPLSAHRMTCDISRTLAFPQYTFPLPSTVTARGPSPGSHHHT